jgi:integrase
VKRRRRLDMLELKLRSGVWYVMGTVRTLDGESVQVRRTTGFPAHQKAMAEMRLSQILGETVKHGGPVKKPYQETVSELIRIYAAKPGGMGETNARHLGKFEERYGDKRLGDLTQKDINDWGYGAGLASEYVRRRIGAVNTLLNYVADYGVAVPPKLKGKAPSPTKGRTRWLTAEERDRFIREISKYGVYHRAIAVFLFYTGARIGEALKLRWRDVDASRAIVSSKKGYYRIEKERPLPLVAEALEALEMLPRRNEWVFSRSGMQPMRYPTVHAAWKKTCQDMGLEDFTIHDARHTFASLLGQSGEVDLDDLRELLGHEDLQMTLRYKHLIPAKTHAAVQVLSKKKVASSFTQLAQNMHTGEGGEQQG